MSPYRSRQVVPVEVGRRVHGTLSCVTIASAPGRGLCHPGVHLEPELVVTFSTPPPPPWVHARGSNVVLCAVATTRPVSRNASLLFGFLTVLWETSAPVGAVEEQPVGSPGAGVDGAERDRQVVGPLAEIPKSCWCTSRSAP